MIRAILQQCFFWFGNTEADAAIAILLPTLKRFSLQWSRGLEHNVFFALKVFYKNGGSFVIAQREFRREFGIHCSRAVPSARAIKTLVRNFETTSSTLKKNGGSVKSVERWLQTAGVTQSSDAQNGVDPFNGVPHYRNVLGCTYSFYTTIFLL